MNCPTGDSLLDIPQGRELLKTLKSMSHLLPRTEYAGVLYSDSSGANVSFKIDTNPANTCRRSDPPAVPTGQVLIYTAHVHPFSVGDSLPCVTVPNGYAKYSSGWRLGLPSYGDWARATATYSGKPNVVFDETTFARYSATLTTLSDVTFRDGANQPVPNASEMANQYTFYPITGAGCLRP